MRLFTRGCARRQIFNTLLEPETRTLNRPASLTTLPGVDTSPAIRGRSLIGANSYAAWTRRLTLPLLVTRLGAADYPQNAFATYDFAVTADLFDRSAYFHDLTSIHSCCWGYRLTAAIALQIRLFHQPFVLV